MEESKIKSEGNGAAGAKGGANPLLTKSRSSENILEGIVRNESAANSNRTTEELIGDVVKR